MRVKLLGVINVKLLSVVGVPQSFAKWKLFQDFINSTLKNFSVWFDQQKTRERGKRKLIFNKSSSMLFSSGWSVAGANERSKRLYMEFSFDCFQLVAHENYNFVVPRHRIAVLC